MSMIKALDYAARHGADIVNASFGGGSFFQDGREETVRFVDELVDRTGMLCTFSAGNNGPALSTVGSPALAERALAIGATVSPTTQASNYGVLDPRRTQLFGFSSRGPLFTGGVGVDFLAPGVALSTVPAWFLESADSWNGTSMAAPQAAGALAVLLSAARAQGLPISYRRVRRSLERSARPLAHLHHVEQGHGMMWVPGAYEELRAAASQPEPILWRVEVDNEGGRGAGLYDRDVRQTRPFRREVEIAPIWPEDTSGEVRAAFSRILELRDVPEWVRVVPVVHVTAAGAELELEIDPAALAPGLSTAEIRLFDQERGHEELTLSLALVRPERVAAPDFDARWQWEISPGDRCSRFVAVPEGATRMRLERAEPPSRSSPTAAGTATMRAGSRSHCASMGSRAAIRS
jgi:tripeptidyl-peptidase-2